MAETKTYTVTRPGHFVYTDGEWGEAQVGDEVELTDAQVVGMGDRLKLVEDTGKTTSGLVTNPAKNESEGEDEDKGGNDTANLTGATIGQVLAMIEAGDVTAEAALANERANSNRKTLVEALERLVSDGNQDNK